MKPLEQRIEEEHAVFADSIWGDAYLNRDPIAMAFLKDRGQWPPRKRTHKKHWHTMLYPPTPRKEEKDER